MYILSTIWRKKKADPEASHSEPGSPRHER